MPATDQPPAVSQGTPTASSDSAAPARDDTSDPPADRKDAAVSSDPTAAGILAAIPGLVTVIAVAAPASSVPAQTGPVTPLSPAATVPGVISTGPSISAPAAGSDEAKVAAPAAQQTDGTGQRNQGTSSAVLDLLTTVPLPAAVPPATDESQTATLPAITSAASNSAAPDQNPQSAPVAPPIITSDAPSGTSKPAAAAAALNPPPPLISVTAESQVPSETVGNPSPPRDAAAVQTALPAQVAVRFAAPPHTTDDAMSDSGTDVLGGASIGATAMAGSSIPPGAALAPSFTGILSTMQMASGTATAPHAAVATDAVPLAAVPIAIVTRVEAGERKFEIRLDPPDLGRIEVQLNVDSSGRATSHLIVDRADTLDLLRRDAPVLERALQSAGLTTDNGSLQFSLRDQSFAGRDQGSPAPAVPPTSATGGEGDVAPLDAAVRRYGPAAGLGGGIDIRV
jgi:flagellar hook-length control protein FliK